MGKDDMSSIRKVDPHNYKIPMMGSPMLHRNLEWYATSDDKILGVVLLDLIDKDYSWVVLADTPEDTPGFCCVNMAASLPTQDEARRILHKEMLKERGKLK
jgi:hypothetical protein